MCGPGPVSKPLGEGERPPVLWELTGATPAEGEDEQPKGFLVVQSPDPVTLSHIASLIVARGEYQQMELDPPPAKKQRERGLPPVPKLEQLLRLPDGGIRQPRDVKAWPLVRLLDLLVRGAQIGGYRAAQMAAAANKLPASLDLGDGRCACGGELTATGPIVHEPCLSGGPCKENDGGPCLWLQRNAPIGEEIPVAAAAPPRAEVVVDKDSGGE